MRKEELPEVWLLIPRYDSNGTRYHTLVHIFISEPSYITKSTIYTADNEHWLVSYILKNLKSFQEKEEIFIKELDFLRFIVLHECRNDLLNMFPVEGTLQ